MKPVLFSLAIAAVVAFSSPALADEAASPSAAKSPIETVVAFGAALEAGDEAALVGLLAADVQIAESGGIERSLEEYRSHHMAADITFSKAVETTVLDRQGFEGGGLVTILTEYVSKGTFRDKPVNSRLMETMVLQDTGDVWKIVHIHWSSASLATDHDH